MAGPRNCPSRAWAPEKVLTMDGSRERASDHPAAILGDLMCLSGPGDAAGQGPASSRAQMEERNHVLVLDLQSWRASPWG